jgi:septation ring formation regulator EzrA
MTFIIGFIAALVFDFAAVVLLRKQFLQALKALDERLGA